MQKLKFHLGSDNRLIILVTFPSIFFKVKQKQWKKNTNKHKTNEYYMFWYINLFPFLFTAGP